MNIQRKITKNTDLEKLSDFDQAKQRWFETQKPQTIEVEVFQVFAFCDTCSTNEEASRSELIASGWHLGSREQFCPGCNF